MLLVYDFVSTSDVVCLVTVATASDGPILRPFGMVVLLTMNRFGQLNILRCVLTILSAGLVLMTVLFRTRVAAETFRRDLSTALQGCLLSVVVIVWFVEIVRGRQAGVCRVRAGTSEATSYWFVTGWHLS